ncbi:MULTISPECIES: ABC transporter permease [Sporosarcina]|uniref:ABC transporter permease n=1 Tax=Sporosarcina TaxID=1569 RepID=UPI00031DCDD9|nr:MULTISPECIES: ABC transporter permease [Sporosarcina]MBY0220840.1 ABC transporter permease [Sporosarcina aquimarina]
MKRLIRNEWRKVRVAVGFTAVLAMLAAIICTLIIYKNYALEAQLEVYEVGFEIFNLIFPLLAVIPTGWLMYFERKNGFINYTLPRVNKKNYVFSKWIVSAGSGYLVVFCVSMISVLVALYVVPPITVQLSLVNPETGELMGKIVQTHIYGEQFLEQPFLYGLVLSLWKGIIGALVATLGFVFSLYSQNLFVILTGPFVYVLLENFCWSVFGLEKYRLVTAFEPSLVWVEAISWTSFVTGPVLLLLVILGYLVYKRKIVNARIYEL